MSHNEKRIKGARMSVNRTDMRLAAYITPPSTCLSLSIHKQNNPIFIVIMMMFIQTNIRVYVVVD